MTTPAKGPRRRAAQKESSETQKRLASETVTEDMKVEEELRKDAVIKEYLEKSQTLESEIEVHILLERTAKHLGIDLTWENSDTAIVAAIEEELGKRREKLLKEIRKRPRQSFRTKEVEKRLATKRPHKSSE